MQLSALTKKKRVAIKNSFTFVFIIVFSFLFFHSVAFADYHGHYIARNRPDHDGISPPVCSNQCVTDDNRQHITQNRATRCGVLNLQACAAGSGDNLGWAFFLFSETTSVQETSTNYWEQVDSCDSDDDDDSDDSDDDDDSDDSDDDDGSDDSDDDDDSDDSDDDDGSDDSDDDDGSDDSDDDDGSDDSDSGDLSYIVTAVNDGLDNTDLYDMASELSALGYSENTVNTDVTKDELISYLDQDITTLYHTGHGSEGLVATASSYLKVSDLTPNKINARNTIWATCLTMSDSSWRDAFGDNAQTIAGYTKVSYDNEDEVVVASFGDYLSAGKSYPEAWYLANDESSMLNDRWAVMAREDGDIVEYSAESGNTPKAFSGNLITVDQAGKLAIAENILNDNSDYSAAFGRFRVLPESKKTGLTASAFFRKLNQTTMSRSDVVAKCKAYLSNLDEFSAKMKLNKSYPILSRKQDNSSWMTIGWVTRFTMKAEDGLQIRGNSYEPYKSVMMTGDGSVVSKTMYWPEIVEEQASVTYKGLLTPSQAIEKAKEEISVRIKQGSLGITDVEPVYGISEPKSETQELVPSYGFSTTDNFVIVVNAMTGDLLP